MTDFNALVEAEVERMARQWEKTEERLHEEIGKLRVRIRALEVMKAVAIRDVPWLVKDFNVLYRVLNNLVQQVESGGLDQTAMVAAKMQLERLQPAFTDTEEVRKAARR